MTTELFISIIGVAAITHYIMRFVLWLDNPRKK